MSGKLMAKPVFVHGSHGDEFPKHILGEIANWMDANRLSKLTINVRERASTTEPISVTVEQTGYSRTSVEKYAPVNITDRDLTRY